MGVFQDTNNAVCPTCMAANLTEEIKFSRCVKCGKLYCIHFASTIDPAYCVECLSDISLIKETITKECEHYDEKTDEVTIYKRRAKRIKLEGLNWLFMQRKIVSISDDALELSIEYHREILSGLLTERETRRTAFLHRYAGIKMPKKSKSSGTDSSTTTKVTKRIRSTKTTATASSVLQAMLAGGMTPEQLMQMLQAKK